MALSGSGVKKGRHIIDPRTHRPVDRRNAAWVCVSSATESDALSTAFMVMNEEEIAALCAKRTDVQAVVIDPADRPEKERVISFGWEGAS
jgi:thiamine biosynthesis lipoprotein ApbE